LGGIVEREGDLGAEGEEEEEEEVGEGVLKEVKHRLYR